MNFVGFLQNWLRFKSKPIKKFFSREITDIPTVKVYHLEIVPPKKLMVRDSIKSQERQISDILRGVCFG